DGYVSVVTRRSRCRESPPEPGMGLEGHGVMRLSVLLVSLVSACWSSTGAYVDVGGHSRGYSLHLPPHAPAGKYPLVIVLHGGGIMSYRLACDLSDRIAAIAPVVGEVSESVAQACHPARPVSVLAINGTVDPLVPYPGGQVRLFGRSRGTLIGATQSVQLFAAI